MKQKIFVRGLLVGIGIVAVLYGVYRIGLRSVTSSSEVVSQTELREPLGKEIPLIFIID